MRAARQAGALALALALTGCMASEAKPHAALGAALRFAAYPHGTLQEETISPEMVGPFAAPGRTGYRVYQTEDAATDVRDYYVKLGKANGWTVSAETLGDPAFGLHVQLDRAPLHLTIDSMSEAHHEGPLQFRLDASVDP
jgi:hypothetical protein